MTGLLLRHLAAQSFPHESSRHSQFLCRDDCLYLIDGRLQLAALIFYHWKETGVYLGSMSGCGSRFLTSAYWRPRGETHHNRTLAFGASPVGRFLLGQPFSPAANHCYILEKENQLQKGWSDCLPSTQPLTMGSVFRATSLSTSSISDCAHKNMLTISGSKRRRVAAPCTSTRRTTSVPRCSASSTCNRAQTFTIIQVGNFPHAGLKQTTAFARFVHGPTGEYMQNEGNAVRYRCWNCICIDRFTCARGMPL